MGFPSTVVRPKYPAWDQLTGNVLVRGPFSFSFNTPGLANGVEFYTPTVGDILHDAWIEIETAFDGTTPLADIGSFAGLTTGLFATAANGSPVNLLTPASESAGTGLVVLTGTSSVIPALAAMAFNPVYSGGEAIVPARFTGTNPLKVVVSQDGTIGGTAVGATVGVAHVYLVTSTPIS